MIRSTTVRFGAPGSRARFALAALPLLLLTAACGAGPADGGAGGWAGTMRDSAGITLVDNPDAGTWKKGAGWTVTPELDIGAVEGSPDYQFGMIRGVDVDSAGTIYVLDGQAQQVSVYDTAGTFERRIGKPGSGPGELTPGASAVLLVGGEMVVPDPGAQRVSIFNPVGDFLRSWRIDLSSGIPAKWAKHDGQLVAQIRSLGRGIGQVAATEPVVVFTDSGTVADSLLTLTRGQTVEMTEHGPRFLLFATEPLWETLGDGRLAAATNDHYRIEIHGPDGALQRVIRLPREPQTLTEGQKTKILELMRSMMLKQGAPPQNVQQAMASTKVADHYPAFGSLLGGPDGSLWVQQVDPVVADDEAGQDAGASPTESLQDLGSPRWDVFDDQGRYLGVVTMPEKFQPLRFVGDELYGVQRDEMDVQHVVRLHLERGPAPSNA